MDSVNVDEDLLSTNYVSFTQGRRSLSTSDSKLPGESIYDYAARQIAAAAVTHATGGGIAITEVICAGDNVDFICAQLEALGLNFMEVRKDLAFATVAMEELEVFGASSIGPNSAAWIRVQIRAKEIIDGIRPRGTRSLL